MTAGLLVALGAITYASRAAALVLLPDPPPRVARILERIPAPLFASLAVLAILEPDGAWAPTPVLAAAAGGLVAAWTRSLLLALLGGLAGYALAVAAF